MERRPEPEHGSDGPSRKKVKTDTVDFATGQGFKTEKMSKADIQKNLATPEQTAITEQIAKGMTRFDQQTGAKKAPSEAARKDTSVPKDDDEQMFDDWINPDAYDESGL
jgi:cell division protein YceG involved in septum cleavage